MDMHHCRVPVQGVQWFFSGTWYDMSRSGDNYFIIQAINSQPLILPAQIKVTSIFGDVVIDTVATSSPKVRNRPTLKIFSNKKAYLMLLSYN